MRFITTLAIILLPLCSQAGIYKCQDENGKTTFSQRPCSKDAEEIQVKVRHQEAKSSEDMDKDLKELSRKSELASLKSKARKFESEIKKFERKMDNEIERLKYKMKFSTNSLAGATNDQQLATQMRAVTEKYQAKIGIKQKELDRVNDKIAKLDE